MSISTTQIAGLIAGAIKDARVSVEGKGGKYQVQVVSALFAGLNRVKRQQAVYRILDEHIKSGAIHAVSMNLQTPDESGQATRTAV